jgi:hypothetical protein
MDGMRMAVNSSGFIGWKVKGQKKKVKATTQNSEVGGNNPALTDGAIICRPFGPLGFAG